MQTIYGQSFAKVRANNTNSDKFSIYRGTRQGCPLSPLLFAIAMGPFKNLIRSTATIKGIKIASKEFKISLFTDDVILFVIDPLNTLENINMILNNFGELSGLHINTSKSEIYSICLKKKTENILKQRYEYKGYGTSPRPHRPFRANPPAGLTHCLNTLGGC